MESNEYIKILNGTTADKPSGTPVDLAYTKTLTAHLSALIGEAYSRGGLPIEQVELLKMAVYAGEKYFKK